MPIIDKSQIGVGSRLLEVDENGLYSRSGIDPSDLVTGLANPIASVGLTTVNGVATTAMRSDAAPALSQAITPVWTGLHTFNVTISGNINGNAATVTTNANLTGPITSVGNATSIASQTGTGTTFAMSASPAFTGTVTGANVAWSGTMTAAGNMTQSRSESGGEVTFSQINTATTASSSVRHLLSANGATAFDAFTNYRISGVTDWAWGVDNSDSDSMVLAASGTLGTSNCLRISTAGAVSVPGTLESASLAGTGSRLVTSTAAGVFGNATTIAGANTWSGVQTFSSTIVGNISGNAATVTTNANLTGPITSSGNATSVASQTGSGSTFAMSASPTFTGTLAAANGTFSGTLGVTGVGTFSNDVTIAGKLGIKDTTPTYDLDIAGNQRIQSDHFLYFGGTGTGDFGGSIFYDAAGGDGPYLGIISDADIYITGPIFHDSALQTLSIEATSAKIGNLLGTGTRLVGADTDGDLVIPTTVDGAYTWAGVQTYSSAPIFSTTTASRLLATNGSKAGVSVSDLTSWVGGTANQITSTSDGDGTLTLSLPSAVTLPGSLTVTTTSTLTGDAGVGAASSSGWRLDVVSSTDYKQFRIRSTGSLGEPLAKWSGAYNSGNGLEIWQSAAGVGSINTNSGTVAIQMAAAGGVTLPHAATLSSTLGVTGVTTLTGGVIYGAGGSTLNYYKKGSLTADWTTGFSGADPTSAITWERNGDRVTINFQSFSGTSDSADCETGVELPSEIRPLNQMSFPCEVYNNGVVETGAMVVDGSGSLILLRAARAAWTASGTKGLVAYFSVSYLIT